MSKIFLVNINMGGNQVINPVIAQGTLGAATTTDSAGLVKVQNLSSVSTTNAATGMIAYDTNAGALKVYNGSSWGAIGAGVTSLNSLTGALSIAGTSNQIAVNAASSTVTLSFPTNVTLPGKTTLTGSTTSGSSLNIPAATAAPTTPAVGDIWTTPTTGANILYYNGTTKTLAFTDSSITGNAATATALQNARTINGTSFDGTANITVTADANTLTGTTLKSTVVNSSLTSVGTLTNLTVTNTITGSVSGNAGTATALQNARTINGTSFDGTANITITADANTLTGTTLKSTVVNSSLTSVGTLSGLTATGTVNLGGATTVTVPTPQNGTDAANKNYVDNVASGVNAHDAVQYATTTTIAGTYTAGSAGADGGTGVGAIITYTSTGVTSIDGGSNLALNDRVLVKNGVTADSGTASKANGIYYVTTAGAVGVATVLTRSLDADNSIAGDIMAGDLVYVVGGTTNGGTQYIQTATGTSTSPVKGIKIGTDSITYSQFSGASSTTAGAGLVVNGNAFDVGTASSNRIVVNADNIDLKDLTVSGGGSLTTGTYGTSTAVGTFTVDTWGRITSASSTNIRLAAADGSTTGLAAFSSTGFSASSGVISLATGTTSQTDANVSGGSFTYATQKQSAQITGDAASSAFVVKHNFGNTNYISVQIIEVTSSQEVEADITRGNGQVTVTFASAPASGKKYDVVIVG